MVKYYDTLMSIKWYFIVSAFKVYPFVSSPKERMKRELNFMTYNWKDKIFVPKIIDFDFEKFILYREYIDGRELKDQEDYELLGSSLSVIHNNNFVLGDTKISNFLIDKYNKKKLYVIDAEQSLQLDSPKYRSWDLLVLLFFIAVENIYDIKRFENISKVILDAYEPTPEIVKGIFDTKNTFLLSFFPVLHLESLRKIIARFL
ncbi:MAG: serine/threonine protein kinase [Sulfolobaceae archaeon]